MGQLLLFMMKLVSNTVMLTIDSEKMLVVKCNLTLKELHFYCLNKLYNGYKDKMTKMLYLKKLL